MPGFQIGGSGQPANSQIESRRKHRWLFSTIAGGDLNSKTAVYLASAQRPHMVTEEAVMHHDQEQVAFAGKHHWEPISLVFYDVVGSEDGSKAVWDWIQKCIDVKNATVTAPNVYKKTSTLEMHDGKGTANETWNIFNCWVMDANWNDVDYSNNEIQTVDVTMKYDRAVRQ